jgi:S-adenosylmethionine:tRNA ribosyltransferase-isomerase
MRTDDFDYALPDELIAQTPVEPRDAARLLVLDRAADRLGHHLVRDLPRLLRPGDLLVANRSRVLPARILGRLRGGGRAELLLLRRLGAGRWEALARPARRLRPDDVVQVSDDLRVHIRGVLAHGLRQVEVETHQPDPDQALLAAGSTPLPPYIRGWTGDPERYQTVFADVEGSAAAPTAGLHFTRELIAALAEQGIGLATLVLHVGLDTFRPVNEADPRQHRMHREWYTIPPAVQQQITAAQRRGGRIVAIGTTSVRALESWAATGAVEGWTDLFILPGFEFRRVQGLLTNFHLPRSSLVMLVSAFAGRERVLGAYAEAIRQRYRFYSFGDAMLVL